MNNSSAFQANWMSPPGDTIIDLLEDKNISVDDFASRMDFSSNFARQLIQGREEIDKRIALQLEEILGAPAEFWIRREYQYCEATYRVTRRKQMEESQNWVRELPIADMVKFGWLKKAATPKDQLALCLDYFDVPNFTLWQEKYKNVIELAAFRTSPTFEPRPAAVSAWLRQGEIQASKIICKQWNAKKFKDTLSRLKLLTRKKNPKIFIPELIKSCADCGVAVTIVRTPAGCRASGATQFISSDQAMMLLSFRYLSDDQFWFTFFHEAGHLLLHGDGAVFLEELRRDRTITQEECEANEFAADFLISKELQPELQSLRRNKREIVRFAKLAGVSPGIVVGQMQYLGLVEFKRLNSYKRRYKWEEVFE